jgi:hypothetical protein
MTWFTRRAEADMARGQEIEDRYTKALASWQIEHQTDRTDMTAIQRERYRQFVRIADAGLDPKRVTYIALAVKKGVVSDDKR